jgi:hypothetical protein
VDEVGLIRTQIDVIEARDDETLVQDDQAMYSAHEHLDNEIMGEYIYSHDQHTEAVDEVEQVQLELTEQI